MHEDIDVVPTAPFNPVRRPTRHNGQVVLESTHRHRQISELPDLSTSVSGRTPPNIGNLDIRNLAREVAAVLYSPLSPNRQVLLKDSSQDMRNNLNSDNVEDGAVSQSSDQPPPNYRAAMGSSSSSHVRAEET